MSCFYDFLSLTGLFSKVALIHNRLLEVIMVDLAPVKSAKVYYHKTIRKTWGY